MIEHHLGTCLLFSTENRKQLQAYLLDEGIQTGIRILYHLLKMLSYLTLDESLYLIATYCISIVLVSLLVRTYIQDANEIVSIINQY